jgi:hypothetical protein
LAEQLTLPSLEPSPSLMLRACSVWVVGAGRTIVGRIYVWNNAFPIEVRMEGVSECLSGLSRWLTENRSPIGQTETGS